MTNLDQAIEEGALAPVGEFTSLQEANEYALVILAMNLDCWMRMEAGGQSYALYASPAFAVAIHEEFRLYAEEQRIPKNGKVEAPIHRSGVELLFLWALILLFVFDNQTPVINATYCNSSLGIFEQGEWHRAFTSLFLHGSLEHLIGNLLLGGIFCVCVAYSIGPVLGWGAILLSGTLGNIATAYLNLPDEFESLGASTATFGALGILAGSSMYFAWKARSVRKLGGAVLPVVAGSIMLGWFGSGGGDPNVDVLAHVMGFAVGAVLGLLIVLLRPAPLATA